MPTTHEYVEHDPASNGRMLGQMLLKAECISPDQLDLALSTQQRSGERLSSILVKQRAISETRLVEFFGRQYEAPLLI